MSISLISYFLLIHQRFKKKLYFDKTVFLYDHSCIGFIFLFLLIER